MLGAYRGYMPLLKRVTEFFKSGIPPVSAEETLEIFAFIEAADISKQKKGKSVDIESLMQSTKKKAKNKTEVIVSFSAILELMKQKIVMVKQDNIFSDITIEKFKN